MADPVARQERNSNRTISSHVRSLLALMLVLLMTAACGTVTDALPPEVTEVTEVEDESEEEAEETPTPATESPSPIVASLRGDPEFDAASLTTEAAVWYFRTVDTIAHPTADLDPLEVAGLDDIYQYGRPLQTYVQSVLLAFRMTGDLSLLDHVDVIAERMRAELRDEWRGTMDGTDGTRDGYLNWVWRYCGGDSFVGKDIHMMDGIKTHAMIAMIAVALDTNRDLESPAGRDYAAHADFWRGYLVDHFEAKWRERERRPTGFPFMTHTVTHAYLSWIKWHHYMGILTGEEGYTLEANRMADIWWGEMREVDTPSGVGYVYPQSILSLGGWSEHLMPTLYARLLFADVVELHLEGFGRWASAAEMERFARPFVEFVLDTDDPLANGYAEDIGGGVSRAGLPSRADDYRREQAHRYALSGFPHIAAWDESGQIADFTNAVIGSHASYTYMMLATGALVDVFDEGDDMVVATAPSF